MDEPEPSSRLQVRFLISNSGAMVRVRLAKPIHKDLSRRRRSKGKLEMGCRWGVRVLGTSSLTAVPTAVAVDVVASTQFQTHRPEKQNQKQSMRCSFPHVLPSTFMDGPTRFERGSDSKVEWWTSMFTETAICMRYYRLGPLLPHFDRLGASTRRPRAGSSAGIL
jgi:hypothetical protein